MFNTSRLVAAATVAVIVLVACRTSPQSADSSGQTDVSAHEREYRDQIDVAIAMARSGQIQSAEDELTNTIELVDADERFVTARTRVAAYYYRGRFRLDLQRPTDARADLEIVLRLLDELDEVPDSLARGAYELLGRARGGDGDPLGALWAFDAALVSNAESNFENPGYAATIQELRAQAFTDLNDPAGAVDALEQAISIRESLNQADPQSGTIGLLHIRLSFAHQQQRNHERAAESARRAIEESERDGPNPGQTGTAYYLLATSLMQDGILEGQMDAYREAVRYFDQTQFPNFEYVGVASFNLGNFHQNRGELEVARAHFERAAEAYGHVLRVIDSRERSSPGSVQPVIRQSFAGRLADARGRLAQIETTSEGASAP